jgi:hypothetical protein
MGCAVATSSVHVGAIDAARLAGIGHAIGVRSDDVVERRRADSAASAPGRS